MVAALLMHTMKAIVIKTPWTLWPRKPAAEEE